MAPIEFLRPAAAMSPANSLSDNEIPSRIGISFSSSLAAHPELNKANKRPVEITLNEYESTIVYSVVPISTYC